MDCEICGQHWQPGSRKCSNCGSRHIQFTLAPRHLLETGIISSLVFALVAISCLLVGLMVDANTMWLGINARSLLVMARTIVGIAIVPALFFSSLIAL